MQLKNLGKRKTLANNPRKFYFGDKVVVVDEQYKDHLDHYGIVTVTKLHGKPSKWTTYEVECECDMILNLRPSLIALVEENYDNTKLIERRRQRFIRILGVSPGESPRKQIHGLLKRLDDKHRTILVDRFGLDFKDPYIKKYETIGEQLGISKQRVKQLEISVINKLKTKSKELV